MAALGASHQQVQHGYTVDLFPGGVTVTSHLRQPIEVEHKFLPDGTEPKAWVVSENGTGRIWVHPMPRYMPNKDRKDVENALRTWWCSVVPIVCSWVAYSVQSDGSIIEVDSGGRGFAHNTCRYHGTRWLARMYGTTSDE